MTAWWSDSTGAFQADTSSGTLLRSGVKEVMSSLSVDIFGFCATPVRKDGVVVIHLLISFLHMLIALLRVANCTFDFMLIYIRFRGFYEGHFENGL